MDENIGRRLATFVPYNTYYGRTIFPAAFRISIVGLVILAAFVARDMLSIHESPVQREFVRWYLFGGVGIALMAVATRVRFLERFRMTAVIIAGNSAAFCILYPNVAIAAQVDSLIMTLTFFAFGALVCSPLVTVPMFLLPNLALNGALTALLLNAGLPGTVSLRVIFYSAVLTIFVSYILYAVRATWVNLYETAERNFLYSNLDTLTKLLNRRSWYERSQRQQEVHNGSATGAGIVSFLMADIDHFKSINDTHGHDCGDAAIQLVSRLLVEGVRESDIPGRLGGEEFGILLTTASREEAIHIADRLRATVEATPLAWHETAIELTISAGLAFAQPSDSIDSLVKRGDECLYRAKKGGRNQVVVE